jgi:hypothetical protein
MGTDTTGTVTVDSITPAGYGDVELMLFNGTACDAKNCVLHGTNSVTISDTQPSYHSLVLDSVNQLWPPDSVTLKLSCP